MENNVYFLYDISIIKFINQYKNADFKSTMIALDEASRSFLWYFRNLKSKRRLIGYDLSLIQNKFKLELIFEGLAIEFRAPWVQGLGNLLSKHIEFDIPFHLEYDDLGVFKETIMENV